MYVEASLNEKNGCSHNFITLEEAKRVGLQVSKGRGWLKTMNANAKPITGTTQGVDLHLGTWKGKIDFLRAHMDDFKVVIGMEFLRKVNAVPMSYYNSVCIMEKGSPCMVRASSGLCTSKTLSAMQLKKGLRKGDITYLAALKVEEPTRDIHEDIPEVIRKVLEENQDVMPLELPRKLPPRREVDHMIELKPGAKPSAMAPYRMAPPKLEELRKNSKDYWMQGRFDRQRHLMAHQCYSKKSTMEH